MTKTKKSNRPTHRVSFARFTGTDDQGENTLGTAREIGSVWPRKSGTGGILRLDHVPIELTRHQGIIFITPVERDEGGFA